MERVLKGRKVIIVEKREEPDEGRKNTKIKEKE